MRVLVIGGAGFIGRHVVAHLARARHDVTVLDPAWSEVDRPPGVAGLDPTGQDAPPLEDVMRGQEIVYLLAGTSNVPATWNAPDADVRHNLLPALEYAQEAARAGVRRIAFASSGGTVYGPFDGAASEDHALAPVTPYGITKLATERFLRYLGKRFGVRTDVYRVANAYGPGQPARPGQGVIAHWMKAIREGTPLRVFGDPDTKRDYVYVEDIATRFGWSLGDHAEDGLWNVGTGRGTSLRELVGLLGELHQEELDVVYEPDRGFDAPSNLLDGSRLSTHFPDAPYLDLREGLRRTWEAAVRAG